MLWQSDIGSLITAYGKTYRFDSFVIQAEKYIQWPKDGTTITDTKSLDKVVEDDVNIFDTVDECEIAGVMSLDCYLACANCKGKIVEKTNLLNVCNKCGMVKNKDHCSTQRKSKLLLSMPGGDYMTLTAFGHLLTQITDSETVTEENLVCARTFGFTHINSVFRK